MELRDRSGTTHADNLRDISPLLFRDLLLSDAPPPVAVAEAEAESFKARCRRAFPGITDRHVEAIAVQYFPDLPPRGAP